MKLGCVAPSLLLPVLTEAFLVLDFQRNLHFKALSFGLSSSWVPT